MDSSSTHPLPGDKAACPLLCSAVCENSVVFKAGDACSVVYRILGRLCCPWPLGGANCNQQLHAVLAWNRKTRTNKPQRAEEVLLPVFWTLEPMQKTLRQPLGLAATVEATPVL